ncbi:MAG: SHOCT domain-containing protein [Chloroflexota bacterium]|nr:SHOCT domain-containing protein [Chloroflexota bacterium]
MRNGVVTLVLVVAGFALVYLLLFTGSSSRPLAYSGGDDSFLALVKAGKVKKVVQQGAKLEITLNELDLTTKQNKVRTSQVPGEFSTNIREDIAAVCREPGAECNPPPEVAASDPPETGQFLGRILTGLLPVILIGVFLFFMLRQARRANGDVIGLGRRGGRAEPAGQDRVPSGEIPEWIRKLAELRDDGIITPEEFEAKKAELLKRM